MAQEHFYIKTLISNTALGRNQKTFSNSNESIYNSFLNKFDTNSNGKIDQNERPDYAERQEFFQSQGINIPYRRRRPSGRPSEGSGSGRPDRASEGSGSGRPDRPSEGSGRPNQ